MESLKNLRLEAIEALQGVDSVHAVYALKTRYLGPKGVLAEKLRALKDLPHDQKACVGKELNHLKQHLEEAFSKKIESLQARLQLKQLGEPVDPSLPSPYPAWVPLHPLTQVKNKILAIFSRLGYAIIEGPEIDTEWFCFDALNVPKNHPARNEQDTFFLNKESHVRGIDRHEDESYLLRTHTSTVQIRTLLKEKPPLKVVSPGRVFRRDTVDATHNFNFHQIEVLCVDTEVTIVDLKGTLDYFVQAFFGKAFKTRLRPSFFPFTEPSFEMDIFVPSLGNFKNRWIEVWGCGMVNPKVFERVGYASEKWKGFAFGIGVERLAMLLYGIDDVRRFYQNDVRFLKQF